MEMKFDLAIVGLGPAGLTAFIYARRFGINCIAIGEDIGGLISVAGTIENYPGFERIEGIDLAQKFYNHALKYGEYIMQGEVKDIEEKEDKFVLLTSFGKIEAKAIILATGSKKRKLNVEGEEKFVNKGISYCTICDAPLAKEKIVGVVGCGNSACESALLLAKYAKKVYLFCKYPFLKGEKILQEEIEKENKIEVVFSSNIKKLLGKEKLEKVIFEINGEEKEYELDFLFVEIGVIPSLELAEKLGLKIEENFIKVNEKMETSKRGVFAAGDITTGSSKFRQIVTACSEGAIAAKSVYEYLKD